LIFVLNSCLFGCCGGCTNGCSVKTVVVIVRLEK